MRDNDHRHAFLGQALHNLQNLADHLRVERRGRLVKQHDIRVHCKRTRNRDTLLLTAGQLRRESVRLVRKADALQKPHSVLARLFLGSLFQFGRGKHHVAHNVQIVEQVEQLEHHTNVLAHLVDIGMLVGDIVTVDNDCAAGDLLEAVEAAQESRLTRTGRPEDNDDLALMDVDRNVLEDFQIAEILF